MDVLTAIASRRSLGRMKQDPVPRSLIEELLEAANWAPTHHRTEPWRFWVFSGEGRRQLSAVFAQLGEKEAAKPLRAPVVIAVGCRVQAAADNVQEEICASAAAVQNLLLAVEAKGLAGIWRSGAATYDERVRSFFGLEQQDSLLGFIYLGYADPEAPQLPGRRGPVAEKTAWFE